MVYELKHKEFYYEIVMLTTPLAQSSPHWTLDVNECKLQGMMISGGMQNQGMQGQVGGGKGPRANQLDGLEAARQENLHKIQQLQQTLDAAHQQVSINSALEPSDSHEDHF